MPRKKKVSEQGTYKVTKTRDDAGTDDSTEATVQAKDSADAVGKAMKGDPRAGRYDSVTAKKSAASSGVRTEPRTVSQVKSNTTGMTYESVDFPYNIGVHQGFSELIDALPKKVTENLTLSDRYGRLHITVPDANTMEQFMEAVGKKSRGRTKVKEMAKVIHNGITESVKK